MDNTTTTNNNNHLKKLQGWITNEKKQYKIKHKKIFTVCKKI